MQKWKIANGLFGSADICYGYSTKDFDEYIKANNVPCVLVKQETSGQICRFYEKEQKEIIVAYLKEKKEERLNCLDVETVGYMTIKQIAKVLNVTENTILNLKNKTDLFADNKTLKTENNRPCLFIRFNDAIENRCRQFLIEHKIKTLNEDLKLRYDKKKIFQLRLGEVFDVESEWFEKMWELVEKYHLTVANTANIGRLLPQAFFYTFAFSRLKKIISGDIYYALSAGNYGNLISGLYGWKFALPVNGFIVPSTPTLTQDGSGKCMVTDSMVPMEKRLPADPANPSNIERLEQVFKANSLMIRSFVFPASVSEEDINNACKELFVKYKIFADKDTSASYAAAKKRSDVLADGDGTLVLVARDDPSIDEKFLLHNLGECPEKNESVSKAFTPVELNKPCISADDKDSLISILNSLNLRRMF